MYDKTAKQVLSFCNTKVALISCAGFLIYFLYYVFDIAVGTNSITGLSIGLIISRIILQQITTGFYEELQYRVLMLEGFFYGKRTYQRKLGYALLNFVVFGLIHMVTGWDTYRFLITGVMGFGFAVVYLNSRNMIIPMILHFIYDVLANLTDYIQWNDSSLFASMNSVFDLVVIIMFVVSVALLSLKNSSHC